ncbi:MAG TPA: hypothetical protein VNH13_01260 [Candidatus Acidoferrales bacterium]|nr:hypothetical protein [Candidatus Acidoferrales bacterium]
MTEPAAPDEAAVTQEASAAATAAPTEARRPTLESRAQRGFGWLSVFVGIVFAVIVLSGRVQDLETVVRLSPGLAAVAALVLAWYGVAHRRRWAVAAIGPSALILVIGGFLAVIVALSRSTLLIPFDVLVGVWILLAAPEPRPASLPRAPTRTRIATIALVGTFAFGAFGPYGMDAVLAAGGLLVAGPSDVDVTLAVQCEAPGPPEMIVISVTPRWHRSEPFATGTDTIVVSWLDQADGGVSGYELAATQGLPDGFLEANRTSGPGTESIVISSDVATSQRANRGVEIVLERQITDAPVTGSVDVTARYVHRPNDPYDPASPGAWEIRRHDACHW